MDELKVQKRLVASAQATIGTLLARQRAVLRIHRANSMLSPPANRVCVACLGDQLWPCATARVLGVKG